MVNVDTFCLVEILSFLAVGFFVGARNRSSYGMNRWNTVAAARFGSDMPARPGLPYLPKAMAAGCGLACIGMFRSCPGDWPQRWLLLGLFALCALSTAGWLLRASEQLDAAQSRRAEHLQRFMEDPAAPVPPRELLLDPGWLRGSPDQANVHEVPDSGVTMSSDLLTEDFHVLREIAFLRRWHRLNVAIYLTPVAVVLLQLALTLRR